MQSKQVQSVRKDTKNKGEEDEKGERMWAFFYQCLSLCRYSTFL